MKLYLRLLRFLKPHLWVLAAAILFMMISTLFNGISLGALVPLADRLLNDKAINLGDKPLPEFISNIINLLNRTDRLSLLNILPIAILLLFFLKGICLFSQTYLMNRVTNLTLRDIKNAIYEKLHSLSLDFYSRSRTGDLVSRITSDTGVIQNSISEGVTDLFYQSFQVILFTTVAFFIHCRLALIVFVLLPFIIYPILRIGKMIRKITTKTQEKVADINSMLFETISGVRIVKAFSMEDYEITKFKGFTHRFYILAMKSIKRMEALGPLTEFIGAIGGVFVLWYGVKEVLKGSISSGVFILFIGSLLSLLRPFKRLGRVHSINQQALAAAKRIFEILDAPESIKEKKNPVILAPIKKEISFEDVWFRYGDTDILQGINSNIEKGDIVAFVGPSGVGKTSLVNLVPRFYDPYKGAIKIDAVNIKDVTISSLRLQIGIVTQETILFNDTVTANIAYGRTGYLEKLAKGSGLTDKENQDIIDAAIAANAHDFIMNMPKGYNTVIGERGFILSGGEKQRIAIARALLKNPPILILDEATSQLDSESEVLVQSAIEKLMQNRTVLVIAHRLSTVRNATKIIVLDDGKVSQTGTHEQLMQEGGVYKRLYQMQFRDQ